MEKFIKCGLVLILLKYYQYCENDENTLDGFGQGFIYFRALYSLVFPILFLLETE
jgi:hypothetical protein